MSRFLRPNPPRRPRRPKMVIEETSLPEGRCYLCGNPVEKVGDEDRIEYTVDARCLPKVKALYDKDVRLSRRSGHVEGPPWGIFNGVFSGGRMVVAEIQCDDSWGLFDSDASAAHYVAWQLGIEPTYPDGA